MQCDKTKINEIACILLISAMMFAIPSSIGYYLTHQTVYNSSAQLDPVSVYLLLKNNLLVLLINLLGLITFGIPNIINCVSTGFIAGCAFGAAANTYGLSWTILHFLPHSAFELPVIIISTSYGLIPWCIIYDKLRGTKDSVRYLIYKKARYVMASALVSVVFLIIAAVIESRTSLQIQ